MPPACAVSGAKPARMHAMASADSRATPTRSGKVWDRTRAERRVAAASTPETFGVWSCGKRSARIAILSRVRGRPGPRASLPWQRAVRVPSLAFHRGTGANSAGVRSPEREPGASVREREFGMTHGDLARDPCGALRRIGSARHGLERPFARQADLHRAPALAEGVAGAPAGIVRSFPGSPRRPAVDVAWAAPGWCQDGPRV